MNYLTEKDLAEKFQISIGLVRKMRQTGTGPSFRKVGVLVRYAPEDVEDWIEAQKRESTLSSAN